MILMLIITGIFVLYVEMLVLAGASYKRALKNKPFGVKYGMFICSRRKQLIGTKTEVMIDPKTGIEWLGKTTED